MNMYINIYKYLLIKLYEYFQMPSLILTHTVSPSALYTCMYKTYDVHRKQARTHTHTHHSRKNANNFKCY